MNHNHPLSDHNRVADYNYHDCETHDHQMMIGIIVMIVMMIMTDVMSGTMMITTMLCQVR